MAKYNIIELSIKDRNLIDFEQKSRDEKEALEGKYAIYVYRSTRTKKVYIGQTIHFTTRHNQHYKLDKDKQRFIDSDFNEVIVVFSQYFNGSSLDDVESQLITYFTADSGKANVGFDSEEVTNRTAGNKVSEYANRDKVATEVILPLWEKVFVKRGWVTTPTLDELRTKALVKYSPIKVLTDEQGALIQEIVDNPESCYVINGDAGTGKTVLLTHLVASLLKERENANIGVVVQPNWEKTGENIFKVFGMNCDRLTVATSTKLISGQKKYDTIIVDESHKLSRKYTKQHNSFNKVYEIDQFCKCGSHLEILQRMGKQIILMYDVLQAIRPANITRAMFQTLTAEYEKRFLTTQFRIQAPEGKDYTSEDYVNGIKYLLYKDTGLLETNLTRFNPDFSRALFRDSDPDAYFGYFTEKPLHKLIEWIERDKNFHSEHVNRILAGLVEDWKQSDGKDPSITHWEEDDIRRRWNSTQENWINSKDPDAEEQIGSVFAVQGIDLNKVGVLIGGDLEVGEDGKLTANPNNFYNINGTFTKEEMELADNKYEFTLFILNIYYVLLTRGIDGIRVGFWHNDGFLDYMKRTLEIEGSIYE